MIIVFDRHAEKQSEDALSGSELALNSQEQQQARVRAQSLISSPIRARSIRGFLKDSYADFCCMRAEMKKPKHSNARHSGCHAAPGSRVGKEQCTRANRCGSVQETRLNTILALANAKALRYDRKISDVVMLK